MPTLRYARGACADLTSYLTANLPTWISTISTEEGRSPALANPDVYRDTVHPFATEPLAIEVECESLIAEDLHNNYWWMHCLVHVVLRAADVDVVSSQENLRSYASAAIRCLMADNTLGGNDVDAEITGCDFAAASADGRLQAVASIHATVKRTE